MKDAVMDINMDFDREIEDASCLRYHRYRAGSGRKARLPRLRGAGRKARLALTLVIVISGAAFAASGLMTPVKAQASQMLIEHAWQRALKGEKEPNPWPWMDSSPVAKISIPALGRDHVVMRGVSGEVMAFAPGWHEGTNFPGEPGITLVSAHKDTHFTYLKNLEVGDLISMTTINGRQIDYRVEKAMVIDTPELQISDHTKQSVIVLSTCYPFSNWQVGGDMRYVVVAREIPADHSMHLAELSDKSLR